MRLALLMVAGLIAACAASEREGRQFFRLWNKNRDKDQESNRVRQRPGPGDRRNGNVEDSDWGFGPFNSPSNPPRTRQQQQPNKEEKNGFGPFFASQQNWDGFGSEESWGPPTRQNTREEPTRQHNAEEKRKPASRPHQGHKEEATFDYDNDGSIEHPERPEKTNNPVVKNTQHQNPFDSNSFPFEAAVGLSKTKPENSAPDSSPTRGKPVALKENGDGNFESPIYRSKQEPQKTFHRPNRPLLDEPEPFVPSKPSSFEVQSAFQNGPSSRFRPEEPSTSFKDTQVFGVEPQRFPGRETPQFDRKPEEHQRFHPQNFGFGQEDPRPSFNEKPAASPPAPKRPAAVPKEADEFNNNSEDALFNPVPPNRPVSQRIPNRKEKRPPLVARPPFTAQTSQAKQPAPIDGQSDNPVFRQRLPDNAGQRPRPAAGQGSRPGIPVMETLKNLMGIGGRQPQQPPRPNPNPNPNRPRQQQPPPRARPQPSGPEGLGDFNSFSPFAPQGEQKESAPQNPGHFFDDSNKGNFKVAQFPGFPQVSSRQQVSQQEPMEHREMDKISAKSGVQVSPAGLDTTPWTPITSATESSPVPVSEAATPATPQRGNNFDFKRQNPRIGNYKQRLEAMRDRAKQQAQAQHPSISRQDDEIFETVETSKPTAASSTTTVRPTASRVKYPPRMQLRKTTTTTEISPETTKSSLNRRSDDDVDQEEEESLSLESQVSSMAQEVTETRPEVPEAPEVPSKLSEAIDTSAEVTHDSTEEATINLKNHKLEYSDNFFKSKQDSNGKPDKEVIEDNSEELRQNWYFANQPYVSADLMSDTFVSPSPKSGKQ